MMGNKSSGIFFGALALAVLLIASPAVAVPTYDSNLGLNALSTTPHIEFANLVAGIGTAVYSQVFIFGGHSGASMPVDPDATGLKETVAWKLTYANQANVGQYLTRAPVNDPDGLSLTLVYPASVANSFLRAGDAMVLFQNLYGVQFVLVDYNINNNFHMYAFHAVSTSAFAAVAGDVAGIATGGFNGLLSASTVTGAPVGWASYGVRTLGGSRVGMHGMGWVDASGIALTTALGATPAIYSLSAKDVFGSVPTAAIGVGVSRLLFSFPYPISPVANGINPATTNPLPHVTGQMMWDLRHPIDHWHLPSTTAADYSVQFEVGLDNVFPNVQNKATINQTKLNVDGILEAQFDLTNIAPVPNPDTGLADAKNIQLSLPLGPDFGKLVNKNVTIYTIKDGFGLDEEFSTSYNIRAVTTVLGTPSTVEYGVLDLVGWYNDTNGDLVQWDDTINEINLVTEDILGTQLVIDIVNPTPGVGFPSFLAPAVDAHIKSNVEFPSSIGEMVPFVKANLDNAMFQSFNDSFYAVYDAKDSIIFDPGDFDVVKELVAKDLETVRYEWFLRATVPSLAAQASESLSFRITDIPVETQRLSLPYFELDESGVYPKATMTSIVQNYKQLMQYIFAEEGFDGRPISERLEDDFTLDLDEVFAKYGSMGMRFTWENDKGYPFFGLSNGQNIQIADDEAVLTATVELDKQVYTVGDAVEIDYSVQNVGDDVASGAVLHLFHASLGRDWEFERVERFATISLGDIGINGEVADTYIAEEAKSFLGYHPVFGVVEFTSDEGQGPASIPDFLNRHEGVNEIPYEAAEQTHQFVMSTLTGGLLLPPTPETKPSIPEARVKVTTTLSPETDLYIDEDLTVTIKLENVGAASTTASVSQSYATSEFDYVSSSSNKGTTSAATDPTTKTGVVKAKNIVLGPGETAEVTIVLKVKTESAVLPPAVVEYSISGESSLGDRVETGAEIGLGGTLSSALSLSASSAAQQESQKSATADSSAAAYSASSSVGASVNPIQNTEEQTVSDGSGFIGLTSTETLALILVPLAFISFMKKQRR
ncbi:MAG: hypothetical protein ACXAD7_07760 [Candidatus Kariarchaeaceae archaeon]|jgi:hypothetical protein